MARRIHVTEQITAGLVLSLALSSIINTAHAQTWPSNTTNPSITAPGPTVITEPTPPTATPPSPSSAPPPSPVLNQAPNAFLGVASATGDGVIFYQGGQLNTATLQYSNELISLDITQSWPISSPAWTNLTSLTGNGGPKVSDHSATMSKDLSTLYLTAPTGNPESPFLYRYNVKTRTWTSENAPAAQATSWSTRRDAILLTDPSTSAIWYLGGAVGSGVETNEIDKYQNGGWNANIPTATADDPRTNVVLNRFGSGTAHVIEARIYLFGGFVSGNSPRSYRNFQSIPWIDISTATPTIGTMVTGGNTPQPRQDHCSVLTASMKIIIFGGYDVNTKQTFSDIWSLDLITGTWQQITPVKPTQPRYGHNCNIVGANMIVYGGRASAGSSGKGEIGYSKDIQVYDRIEIREAELEKAAYLASLGSDGERDNGDNVHGSPSSKRSQQRQQSRDRFKSHRNNPYGASATSPHSGSTRRLNEGTSTAANTPGMSHYGLSGVESTHNIGREEPDQNLNYTAPPEQPGVQYLMQQLPDGTIAVQPVYLDHQPIPLQNSPNMVYSETSRLGALLGTPTAAWSLPAAMTTSTDESTGIHTAPQDPFASSAVNQTILPSSPSPKSQHKTSLHLARR
ncbi:hypothetical protein BGZ65_001830 [Modicella reniformis]|uniref:Galactose oxidase n=1 Tax=Modicella reniformis TaxID=1440133 RepID=A0A9P6MJ55_9FUNG|nr:hypothetical protein BGZ65_001830 [Modicella reniformis]